MAETADPTPGDPALDTLRGLACGLGAVLIWGCYFSFGRSGTTAGLGAADFTLLRHATALAVCLPLVVWWGLRDLGGIGWGRATVLAALVGPASIALGLGGLSFAPLSHAAIIQPSTAALSGIAAGALLLREPLPARRLLGTALIIAGIALIAGRGLETSGASAWVGDLMFVCAGLLWTGFTLLLRHWRLDGVRAAVALNVVSGLVFVPLWLLLADRSALAAAPPSMLVVQALVQGLLSGVAAVMLYARAVGHLGASRAALFPAMVPTATLLVSVPITGEWPQPIAWLGAALASVGLAVAMAGAGRAKAVAPPALPTRHRSGSDQPNAKNGL